MKVNKIKYILLVALSFALVQSNLKYKEIDSRVNGIESNILEKIEARSNSLLTEIKSLNIDHTRKKDNSLISYNNFSNSLSDSGEKDNDTHNFVLCEEEIQYIYSTLEQEAKDAIVENLDEIPELEFIYKIGTFQPFDLEDFLAKNPSIVDALNDIKEVWDYSDNEQDEIQEDNTSCEIKAPLKLAGTAVLVTYGITETLLSSILASVGTAASAIWIPFVGWIIAAAAIVALAIIIATNWDTIRRGFDILVDYLCEKYPAISSLIRTTCNDGLEMACEDVLDEVYNKTISHGTSSQKGLTEDLEKALNFLGSQLVSANALIELFKRERPTVYLGCLHDNIKYYLKGEKTNSVYFHCSDDVWKTICNNYYNHDAWPVNEFFLNLMIKLDCIFKLCSAPDKYFLQESKTIFKKVGNITKPITLEAGIQNDSSYYAKELHHIFKCGYRWYSNIPIVTADHL